MKHYLYLNRKFSLEGCLSLSCEYIEIYQLFKMTFKDFPFLSSPPQTVLAVCYYKTIFLLFKIVTEFIPEDCFYQPLPRAQPDAACSPGARLTQGLGPQTHPSWPHILAQSAAEVQACSKRSYGEWTPEEEGSKSPYSFLTKAALNMDYN